MTLMTCPIDDDSRQQSGLKDLTQIHENALRPPLAKSVVYGNVGARVLVELGSQSETSSGCHGLKIRIWPLRKALCVGKDDATKQAVLCQLEAVLGFYENHVFIPEPSLNVPFAGIAISIPAGAW